MEYDLYKQRLGAALAAAIQQRTGLNHHQCRSIHQSGTCIFVEQDSGATLMVVVTQVPEYDNSTSNKEKDEGENSISQHQSKPYQLAFYASLSDQSDDQGSVCNTKNTRRWNNDEPY